MRSGFILRKQVAHARRFQLEDAGRGALAQLLVGFLVVEGNFFGLHSNVVAFEDHLFGFGDDGERLQTQEVEFDQARFLVVLVVELRDRHVGAGVAIERHEFVERAVAHDDAGGMRRGVAVEAFETARDFEQAGDGFLFVFHLLQARLHLDRLAQRDRLAGLDLDHLGDAVDLALRHLQDAADVADGGARLQRSEGDDLGDAVVAVFALNIADDFAAPVLAEVDIEVRHRDAFGIEKAFEHQAEAQGIERGDLQSPKRRRSPRRNRARRRGCPARASIS